MEGTGYTRTYTRLTGSNNLRPCTTAHVSVNCFSEALGLAGYDVLEVRTRWRSLLRRLIRDTGIGPSGVPAIAESRARSGPRTGRAWYARKYARDHPSKAQNQPPPAKGRKKTPRQVRDLPRGVDLPACLTGQCANQAAPRPRRLHISYFARMGQGAGARWPLGPVSSSDRAGRSGPMSLTDIGQH